MENPSVVPLTGRGSGGTGGVGYYLEARLGSEGSNRTMADCCNEEVKYWGGGGYWTLYHKDPKGGKTVLLPILDKYGYRDERGRLALRHTIGHSTNNADLIGIVAQQTDRFRIALNDGLVCLCSAQTGEEECFWDRNVLRDHATKLKSVILVQGRSRKDAAGKKYVTFLSAIHLSQFHFDDFLKNIVNGPFVLELDLVETYPGRNRPNRKHPGTFIKSDAVKNPGTKLRIKPCYINSVWDSVELIHHASDIPVEKLWAGVEVDVTAIDKYRKGIQ